MNVTLCEVTRSIDKKDFDKVLRSVQTSTICYAVLPSVMKVELRREAGGLGDGTLLCSSGRRLGSGWCRRTHQILARLSCCLARLSGCLTRLSAGLARVGACLSWLGYRAGLSLGALFLGHGALLLWAGARLGTCTRQRGRQDLICVENVKISSQGE